MQRVPRDDVVACAHADDDARCLCDRYNPLEGPHPGFVFPLPLIKLTLRKHMTRLSPQSWNEHDVDASMQKVSERIRSFEWRCMLVMSQ